MTEFIRNVYISRNFIFLNFINRNQTATTMKSYLIIILLVISQVVFSQENSTEKPNYKKIGKAVSSKSSKLSYPSLMKRYLNSDSTLSLDQKRHLYYGYTFQPSYDPYGFSAFNDSIRSILNKEVMDTADYHLVNIYADSLLAHNPFDVKALNNKLLVYDFLKDENGFMKIIIKMNIIFDAILSSGDGMEPETSIYVIETHHEYEVLNLLGFKFGGQQSLIGTCDYLTVRQNQYRIEGFYFDVSPCLEHLRLKK